MTGKSSTTTSKWDEQYLRRMAERYLEVYEVSGFEDARKWYQEFLTPELREAVKPFIHEEAKKKRK